MRRKTHFVATALLSGRVFWELMRYDALLAIRGFRCVTRIGKLRASLPPEGLEIHSQIDKAFASVAPFYWKPVRCLQRSVVLARLMRARGIPAAVVIGYRPAPFSSHAWVEVSGRIVNDSPAYQRQLRVLERL